MTEAERPASKSLKLTLEPDDYLCNWLFPDGQGGTVKVPGAITLGRADTQPRGTAFGDGVPQTADTEIGGLPAYGFPQHATYPVLRAELDSNHSVTLLSVSVETWFAGRALIYAAAAMVGLYDTTDDGQITGLRLQVTGLDAAWGNAPVRSVTMPQQPGGDTEYGVKVNLDKQAWKDDQAELSLSYIASAHLGDAYEYGFTFGPLLTVTLAAPTPLLDAVHTWVTPVQRLMELASGKGESITFLQAIGKNGVGVDSRWQVFGSGIDQRPYDSNRIRIMETKSALNLHGDGDSLLALVRAWNTHDADGHPFLETFAKDLRWLKDQPPRAQVLTLCQAVEGAHDHTHAADVEQQQTQYTEKRPAVLDAIKAAGIFHGKDRKFVKGGIPPRAPSNLRTPLHWTASVAPGDLPARAAAIALVAEKTPKENGSDWSDGIRVVRNDLSHGRTIPRDKLRPLAKLLTRHLRVHTLTLLGASAKVADRIHAVE